MHASVQQRVKVAAALRVRTQIATAEFYALIGREQPVQKIRYQVMNSGKAYHIVERSNGKVRGFRWTHKEAISFAESLESRTALINCQDTTLDSHKEGLGDKVKPNIEKDPLTDDELVCSFD